VLRKARSLISFQLSGMAIPLHPARIRHPPTSAPQGALLPLLLLLLPWFFWKVRARMARCCTGAPLQRRVGVDRPRSGHRHGCRCLFASTWMCCRKARPRLADFPGRKPGKRGSGVAFLFGYLSLWPRKEKVTRLPKADESSRLLSQAW